MSINYNLLSTKQAHDFCSIFKQPFLWIDGKIKLEHLKPLDQTERKTCLLALTLASSSELLTSTVHGSKRIEQELKVITSKINTIPKPKETVAWYLTPFVWIAKIVHSIFLWFQNKYLGRISSHQLEDKIQNYLKSTATKGGSYSGAKWGTDPDIIAKSKFGSKYKPAQSASEAAKSVESEKSHPQPPALEHKKSKFAMSMAEWQLKKEEEAKLKEPVKKPKSEDASKAENEPSDTKKLPMQFPKGKYASTFAKAKLKEEAAKLKESEDTHEADTKPSDTKKITMKLPVKTGKYASTYSKAHLKKKEDKANFFDVGNISEILKEIEALKDTTQEVSQLLKENKVKEADAMLKTFSASPLKRLKICLPLPAGEFDLIYSYLFSHVMTADDSDSDEFNYKKDETIYPVKIAQVVKVLADSDGDAMIKKNAFTFLECLKLSGVIPQDIINKYF